MKHKYGEFSFEQFEDAKEYVRKQIFFLLLIVDPNTKDSFKYVNQDEAFHEIMNKLSGMNHLLGEPTELVMVLSLLEEAYWELQNPDFEFKRYRKLILDAGSEVLKIKEGGDNAES